MLYDYPVAFSEACFMKGQSAITWETYTPRACGPRRASVAASTWALSETLGCTQGTYCCSPRRTHRGPPRCLRRRPCRLLKPKHTHTHTGGGSEECVARRGESVCVQWSSRYHDAEGLSIGREGLRSWCPVVWFAWEETTVEVNGWSGCTGNALVMHFSRVVLCTVCFQPLGGNVTQYCYTFSFIYIEKWLFIQPLLHWNYISEKKLNHGRIVGQINLQSNETTCFIAFWWTVIMKNIRPWNDSWKQPHSLSSGHESPLCHSDFILQRRQGVFLVLLINCKCVSPRS